MKKNKFITINTNYGTYQSNNLKKIVDYIALDNNTAGCIEIEDVLIQNDKKEYVFNDKRKQKLEDLINDRISFEHASAIAHMSPEERKHYNETRDL